MGVVLWLVDRMRPDNRPLESIRWSDAILIGVAQAFALLPGVSRSGATITAGRALALDRASAATFSFLMSMPIIAAAAVFKVPHLLRSGGASLPLLVGVLASAISGWLAIAIVMRYVRSHSYGVFAAYRVVLGARRARALLHARPCLTRSSPTRYAGASAATIAERCGVPRVELYDELTSTLDVAHPLARDGAPEGTLILAERQTAGRGRNGRAWASENGAGIWIDAHRAPRR